MSSTTKLMMPRPKNSSNNSLPCSKAVRPMQTSMPPSKTFPSHLRGTVSHNLPYSAWQLLEHLRITQRDILNFCAPPTGGYQPLEWPAGYWPADPEPPRQSRLG